MKIAPSIILGFSLAAFACASQTAGRHPLSQLTPPLFPGEEWGPKEDAMAERIAEDAILTAKTNMKDGFVRRDAHPKHHGCVRAKWITNDILKDVGRDAGLFSQPGQRYDAWIRFSNGSPGGAHAPDSEADVRGFALKLMNVRDTPLGSQDFVMMSANRFFSKDAQDYLALNEALRNGGASILGYLATHPKNALRINSARIKVDNPVAVTYFSPVPNKIGNSSMRVKAAPCGEVKAVSVDKSKPDFLREALSKSVAAEGACYNFYVQINENPEKNLIEEPRDAWDEEESPYIFAARLEIPKQSDITDPKLLAFCENASFNPWNTQEEVRPLGQINRIRKVVYDAMSKYRHEENHVAPAEPRDLQPCSNAATAGLCQPR